ncbi:eukaryotic translation initiation factor 4B isoform X1 [Patella vulgata]|uniref:eukaryotic translation initiation factor 4B isoform X1 n=1 Tax=Patella vulgata TaxID=6465 RepID=UPI0021805533|nr:eukaryotic translation initiation factor 4B isoform X1 [Patella vulgata]
MASGGKKNKKKGKSMNLSEFLGSNEPVVSTKNIDWAAEMENADDDFGAAPYGQQLFDRSKLPKAPKAARGPDVDMSKVPTQPPFTAFIGNLPYESCEDKIEMFFSKLKFLNVRLPSDQGRLRGFGYVEFEDRESLLEALTMDDSMFAGRKIRIDLAGQNQNNQGGSSDGRSRDQGPDRTDSDWRRPGPDTPDQDDRGGRYGDRDGGSRYGDRDGGSRFGDRDGGSRFGDRDGGSRFGDRDGGRYGDRDGGSRYGGGGRSYDRGGSSYGDRDGGRYGDRDGGRYGGDRDGGRYGGDRDGGRYGGDRGGGRYGDRDRGYGGGSYGGSRGGGYEPANRESSQEAPKERKRLQLAPRSKPVENDSAPPANDASATPTPSKTSSIFGNAKPVDTAAKEREIFERLHSVQKPPEEETPKEREKKPSIFGDAKPVNTAAREKEIEERLRKQRETERVLADNDRNYESPAEENYQPRDSLAESDNQPSGRMRRDSEENRRVRRDSEENRRERHLSNSSSGKGSRHSHNSGGVRSRKDSDLSNHSQDHEDNPSSPKHEVTTPVKVIPAPPPKENAWQKRKPEIMSPPSQQPQVSRASEGSANKTKSPGDKEMTSRQNSNDKPRSDRDRDGYRDRKDDRPKGPPIKYDGKNKENTKPKREKPVPKSFEEMPKYNKGEAKDWSDQNKFALISSSKSDEEEDDDDRKEEENEETTETTEVKIES